MDYSRIYIELMERAADRVLEGYTEKHHIVPKCMGGDDKPRNIAILTPEEHYLAHQLLVKIYPENHKLVYAANMMVTKNTYSNNLRGNKLYGWLRKKLCIAQSNRIVSDATKMKISEAKKGKKHSIETKRKMSIQSKGVKKSKLHRDNISKGNKGKVLSEQTRQKISIAHSGKVLSKEQKRKIGENGYFKGKFGSDHNRSKAVLQIDKNTGEILNTFGSQREAARILGIEFSGISDACRGKLKTSGGFIWRYVKDL